MSDKLAAALHGAPDPLDAVEARRAMDLADRAIREALDAHARLPDGSPQHAWDAAEHQVVLASRAHRLALRVLVEAFAARPPQAKRVPQPKKPRRTR